MATENSTLSPEAIAMVQKMHEMAARFMERHEAGEVTYADQVQNFLAQAREAVGDNAEFLTSSRQLLDTLGPEEFGPTLDDQAVQKIEQTATSQDVGICRRLALSVCASGSRSALDLAGSPAAYALTLSSVREFKRHVAALAEIAETAEKRLQWAGDRFGALPNGWRVLDGKRD